MIISYIFVSYCTGSERHILKYFNLILYFQLVSANTRPFQFQSLLNRFFQHRHWQLISTSTSTTKIICKYHVTLMTTRLYYIFWPMNRSLWFLIIWMLRIKRNANQYIYAQHNLPRTRRERSIWSPALSREGTFFYCCHPLSRFAWKGSGCVF